MDVLPKIIRGKGVEIIIDAPILSDSAAIENALGESLKQITDRIVGDMKESRLSYYAEQPPTPFNYSYYSNSKIPLWRGGLLNSVESSPSDYMTCDIAFTSPYAMKIQTGGALASVDMDWVEEHFTPEEQKKITGDTYFVIHQHKFMEGVTETIDSHLEDWGYLQELSTNFVNKIT